MSSNVVCVLFLFTAAFCGGCKEVPSAQSGRNDCSDWAQVADLSGADFIAHLHVHELLARQGIESLIEGSVFYGVRVPPQDGQRAVTILQSDAVARGYPITVFVGNSAVHYGASEDAWRQVRVLVPYDAVIQWPEYLETTALGKALRHPRVRELAARHPLLYELWIWERKYLSGSGPEATGYVLKIEFRSDLSPNSSGARTNLVVLDGGATVEDIGGNEWWPR